MSTFQAHFEHILRAYQAHIKHILSLFYVYKLTKIVSIPRKHVV